MTREFTRRAWLGVAGMALGSLWASRARASDPGLRPSASEDPPGLEEWVGRGLQYRARCELVGDLATGELRLQRIRGTSQYVATFQTELEGVVGFFTLQRSDLFVTLMTWSPEHGRFLPVWHGDQASRKGNWRRKILLFQRDRDEYLEIKMGPDKRRERRWRMRGRLLDDPLSAFFNWRVGAFGALGDERDYEIDNLARKEPLTLRFRISAGSKVPGNLPAHPEAGHRAHFLRARLEEELQEAVRGDVEGWLDADWVPIEATANRVRLAGEVTATLVRRRRLPDPELASPPSPPLDQVLWRI
jgi:hypothetical protein